jgi:hypothetical protein
MNVVKTTLQTKSFYVKGYSVAATGKKRERARESESEKHTRELKQTIKHVYRSYN